MTTTTTGRSQMRIRLTQNQRDALQRIADRRGSTEQAVAAAAIDEYLQRHSS